MLRAFIKLAASVQKIGRLEDSDYYRAAWRSDRHVMYGYVEYLAL